MPATQSAATALEARLEALEAREAVLDTLYRYAHAIDYGLREEWLDCFTDDGVFDIWRDGENIGRYEGAERLRAFISVHTHAPNAYHKHFLVEPRIAVTGGEATVASYFARLDREHGKPVLHGFGRYLDEMRRGPDGRWRFRVRRAEVEAFDDAGAPINRA